MPALSRLLSSIFFLLGATAASIADPYYGRTINIPPDSSPRLQEIAGEMAALLQKAGAESISIVEGDPTARLSLAVDPEDPAFANIHAMDRDAFAIRADRESLRIIGVTEMAVENGVHWLLHRYGFRWLHPTEKWTIIPELDDLRLELDVVEVPAFYQREFFGTGGFGRPARDPKQEAKDAWAAYRRQNLLNGRDPQSIRLGGHAGEAFVAAHKETLRANPEMLAMTDGSRHDLDAPRSPIKLCTSNPELRELWIKDRLDNLRRQIERNPSTIAISVDPSDGGRHCECDACAKIGNGSPSDQVFFLANQTAEAVAKEFPGKFVNLYAYNRHADTPSFDLEPNTIVSIIPYAFQTTGLTPEQFIAAWKDQAPVFGLYDYWDIPDWSRNVPDISPQTITERVRLWHESGANLFLAESTFCGGSMGPQWYLAARLLWDPNQDADAILDDYFTHAFGSASGPVRRMHDRWWEGEFILSDHEIALSLRDLDEAMRSNKAPAIQARLVDLARYLHYLGLWYEYRRTKSNTPERIEAAQAVVNYLWRVYDSQMLQVFRLAQLLNRDDAPHLEDLHMDNPMWAEVPQLSDDEMLTLFRADLEKYQPLDFEPKRFDGPLAPLADKPAIQTFPSIETQRFGRTATFQFFVPADMDSVPMEIEVGRVGGRENLSDRVLVTGPDGSEIMDRAFSNVIEGWQAFDIPTSEPGVYSMQVFDRKNTFRLKVPEGLPFVCTDGFTSTDLSKRTYFFVPPGTRRIALHTPGVIPLKLFDPDGSEINDPRNEERRNLLLIDVPEGQDGRTWSFSQFKAWFPLELLNCPNVFAQSPETLLVPEE